MNTSQKGFTLIELLVVVAIIGVLSTVVLTSLSTARARANDAKIKAQLSSIRTEALLIATNVSVCSASTITALREFNPPAECSSDGSFSLWAVKKQLSTGEWFCVDHTTYANVRASNPDISGPAFDCQ